MIDAKWVRFGARVAASGACALASVGAVAQAPADCRAAEHRQFDFWIGDWIVRWTDAQGRAFEGRNRIRKTLDDCVVLEEFDGRPGTPLRGISVSTYDRKAGRWRQTWVDNGGRYLDFEGGIEAGRMVLVRRASVGGRTVLQRMVFGGIERDALTWDWQRSDDEGRTWTTTWRLAYRRVP
ncbi:MAG: DUF1579 domain-containing protein [Burkholderiaceae bacterium]|nr:DUF1579 domain-containing protein [Burkholderiaceae bacterium]